MNEVLILWILSILSFGLLAIFTPISYLIYKINGGKEKFIKWLLYEV